MEANVGCAPIMRAAVMLRANAIFLSFMVYTLLSYTGIPEVLSPLRDFVLDSALADIVRHHIYTSGHHIISHYAVYVS